MNVEDGAVWLDVRDVAEDHGDTTQVAGRRADVGRQGLRGEHLLEEGALDGDVPAEIERGVAEDLVDHPASYKITVFERPRIIAKTGTSGGPIRPTETYELAENATGGTTVTGTIGVQPAGAARIAVPFLALLHPLFAWEASWLDNARDILQKSSVPQ
jgi:hypothetical protein